MADHDQVLQVQIFDQFGQIVGILVHIVAIPGLGGTAVAAAVMGDHAISLLAKKHHLGIPCIGR